MHEDPFDDLFSLEDRYYDEGYQQGFQDGLQQSQTQARLFGIEKGFEKFLEMGKIEARVMIWSEELEKAEQTPGVSLNQDKIALNARIKKHMEVLHALVDPQTLSVENTDDAVSDFDDRLKRAQAKCRIVAKLLGEPESTAGSNPEASSQAEQVDGQKPKLKEISF